MNTKVHRVFATHEEEQELCRGPWLGNEFLGVALPCVQAWGMFVIVRYNGNEVRAQVRDVGPFCVDDHDYVFGNSTPRAELMKGKHIATTLNGRIHPTVPDGKGGMRSADVSNGAGIDLFPGTADALGIKIGDNVWLEWYFDPDQAVSMLET